MTKIQNNRADSIRRILAVLLLTAILCCMMASVIAFAETKPDEAIQKAVSSTLKDLYRIAIRVAIPYGIIMFCWGGLKLMSPDDRGPQKARSIFIWGGLGLAVIFLAPLIITAIKNTLSTYGEADWDNAVSIPTKASSAAADAAAAAN